MGETPSPKSEAAAELKVKLGPLPPALAREITGLVEKALPLGIALDRVLPYALLLSVVERRAQGETVSQEHASRAWHELAGSIHGLETGYRDARSRYAIPSWQASASQTGRFARWDGDNVEKIPAAR
jgi:hypothetical protein